VILSDEIYDQMVYDDAEFIPLATLVRNTVCLTYSGLSKVYRACGYRVGWCVFTGELEKAASLKHAMATTLPDPDVINDVFSRIDTLLGQYA